MPFYTLKALEASKISFSTTSPATAEPSPDTTRSIKVFEESSSSEPFSVGYTVLRFLIGTLRNLLNVEKYASGAQDLQQLPLRRGGGGSYDGISTLLQS